MKKDVIIIGAGASGLMCAIEAGKRGRSVIVLEHTGSIGSKIRVSGGGRCNFTNQRMGREFYLSKNPHFCTSALSRFGPADFITMLEDHGIGYQEREDGQLFCDGNSREIVGMLLSECENRSITFQLDSTVSEIRTSGTGKRSEFTIETNKGAFVSESLVIATGGLSYPSLGASNFGYGVARQFGIRITSLNPALTPLRFSTEDAGVFGGLSGISIDCRVSHGKIDFRGGVLFTHKGLSGPAILQISSYWDRKTSLSIDLLPSVDIHAILLEKRNSKSLIPGLLENYLPRRFVKAWCRLFAPAHPVNQLSSEDLKQLSRTLHDWRILPQGLGGFDKAEVTSGGIDTDELSSKTMEVRKVPGLYFVGEVVDVTGHLGGYNLHWAWASGHAAGQCA